MKKKVEYIDGLKGIGCMMVMLGHYYCIYSLAERFVPMPKVLDILFKITAFFLDADLGLLFFAIISGYCIGFTRIRNIKELLWAIVKRFFRFVIPVLGANLIIYMCYLLVGFHNGQTTELFTNTWFQGYYQGEYWLGLAVRDSVHTIIGNGAVMNPTFWVIRYFFFSSIIVYAGSYLQGKCDRRFRYLIYVVEFVIAAAYYGTNGTAIVLGSIWNKEQGHSLLERIPKRVLATLSVICFILLSGGAEAIAGWTHLYLVSDTWAKIIYAIVILYTIGRMESLQRVFADSRLIWLSKWSFGIYALHWPIMCSVTSWLFLQVAFGAGTYLLIGVITVLLVILLAIVYHYTVEWFCNNLLRVFDGWIRK